MQCTRLDLTFAHAYKVDIIEELPAAPGGLQQIYFPGAKKEGGKDGLIVKVTPKESVAWIGVFDAGYASPNALTKVFSCPDSLSLCVISSGKGYFVRVDNPSNWEAAIASPIIDARTITELRLLLFADFTTITAYGANGITWRTPDLSWDGLKITNITGSSLRGLAWDSVKGHEVDFFVDLQTGYHEGGSSPSIR